MVLLLAKVLGPCRTIEYTEEKEKRKRKIGASKTLLLPALESSSDGKKLRHSNHFRSLLPGLLTGEQLALRKPQCKDLILHLLAVTSSGENVVFISMYIMF